MFQMETIHTWGEHTIHIKDPNYFICNRNLGPLNNCNRLVRHLT